MEKTGFFEEAPQQKSANRLVFIVGSVWAMALCSYLAFTAKASATEILALFSSVQAVLGGQKLLQKQMENKANVPA